MDRIHAVSALLAIAVGAWTGPAARAGEEGRVEALKKELHGKDPNARQAAVWALAKDPSDAAFRTLLEALGHGDAEVRLRAVMALGGRKNREAAAPLRAYREKTADDTHRLFADGALARLGEADAIENLARALGDPRGFMRTNAASELNAIGTPAAPHLIRTLETGPDTARPLAAEILGNCRDKAAVAPLLRATEVPALRERAAEALGKIGDPSALPRLRALRDGDPDMGVRIAAALAAAQAGDGEESFAFLVRRLEDPGTVAEAASALGTLRSPAALDPLLAALDRNLKTGDHRARYYLAGALGRLGDRRAVQPLLAALRASSSDDCCAGIASSLNRLTGKNVDWEKDDWKKWEE